MNKLLKISLSTLLIIFTMPSIAQLTKIGNWNAYVYNPNKQSPLVLYFGGLGQSGTNPNAIVTAGLSKILYEGFKPPVDWLIVCPQGQYGGFDLNHLRPLVIEIKKKYPLVDTSKIYVTGISRGSDAVMGMAEQFKPLGVFPVSPGFIWQSAVNAVVQKKIYTRVWAGTAEPDYYINALNYFNAVKSGTDAGFIILQGKGHSGWDENVYKTAEFWSHFKETKTKDTIVYNLSPFILPAGKWSIKSTTAKTGTYGIQFGRLVTMNEGTFILDGPFVYTIQFIKPDPPKVPLQIATITISGHELQLFDNGTYKCATGSFEVKWNCKDAQLFINKNYTWEALKK